MNIYVLAIILFFQIFFASNNAVKFSQSAANLTFPQKQLKVEPGVANIIFQSTDGGQTWQDISQGLPKNLQGDGFFANDKELYLNAGNAMYQRKQDSKAAFWIKEMFLSNPGTIVAGRNRIFAYNHDGRILQKLNGTGLWLPIYTNFTGENILTVFETDGGTVFIGSRNGIFKSADGGKSWKQVNKGGWVMKLVESAGVLLATSVNGILRSADDGENWELVVSEGGVGIAAERISGGFAVITYNDASKTRRVRTSYDAGKTWQRIDAGLPPQASIASIMQVGEFFLCGHPDGIYRSADKGKTWKLLLPSIENKVFNLSVSGNVIYAIPRGGGC